MKYLWIVALLSLNSVWSSAEDGEKTKRRPRSPVTSCVHAPPVKTEDSLYNGQYVHVTPDGKVHILQTLYPTFKGIHREGVQFFAHIDDIDDIEYINGKYYRTGNPLDHSEILLWEIIEIPASDAPFVPQPVEVKLSDDPYTIIVLEESCKESPYFSCGWLHMSFPLGLDGQSSKGKGSAAAIDKNILVTAAHNFLPQIWQKQENTGRVKANQVQFLHIKTKGKERLACEITAAHCFIHPKWEESFDPHYDIAVVFLNESLVDTEEEKNKLLNLHISPHDIEPNVRVVGYPLGVDEMRHTKGSIKQRQDRPLDAINVIYHTANTECGNSGSPIVRGDSHLIGIHTRGPSPGGTMNRGVRVRLDLMPFLDEVIGFNQQHLAALLNAEADKAAKRTQTERKVFDEREAKGRAEGLKEGKIEIAKALINEGMKDDLIVRTTGLTLDQVQALRRGETIQ